MVMVISITRFLMVSLQCVLLPPRPSNSNGAQINLKTVLFIAIVVYIVNWNCTKYYRFELSRPRMGFKRTTNTTANTYVFDSTRGVNKYVITNSDASQSTDADTLTAFNSDGFSIGSDANTNSSTDTYHFLAWKNGGTTSTNNDGTVAVPYRQMMMLVLYCTVHRHRKFNDSCGLSGQPDLVIVKDTGGHCELDCLFKRL